MLSTTTQSRSLSLVSIAIAAPLLFAATTLAQTAITYQKPPAPIEQLLDAPATPTVSVAPNGLTLLIAQPQSFPSIAEVARPRYRLAGIRFNPRNAGPSVTADSIELRLQTIAPGSPKAITGLPPALRASDILWSPDSKHIAFVQRSEAALDLWVIDIATAHAHRVGLLKLNSVLGRPCAWLPNSAGLLCKTVPATRGPAPKISEVPTGPHVSENLGKVTPAPTYEDMLSTPDDENIFEYYATSQLVEIPLTGPAHPLPLKGLIGAAMPSPDGHYALVELYHRPFSYTVPYQRFPLKTEVVTLKTGTAKVLLDRPVVDNLPISRDAVEPGPRDYQWRSDVPSTLVWVEAANGGLPTPKAPVADYVKALPAPFTGEPTTILEAPLRLARAFNGASGGARGLEWGNAHLAIATVSRFSDRKSMILAFDPSTPGKVTTIYEGSSQDRYHSPGRPLTVMNTAGHPVLKLSSDAQSIYFLSDGASRTGDKPFIATMPLTGGKETILYRSTDPYYIQPVAVLPGEKLLVRRESQTESPNYFTASLSDPATALTQITTFPSPYAGINMPTHEVLHYKRADGLDLTATLWLPYGYTKSQGPLPTLMEAYPAEFKTRAAASQVAGSPNRFPTFGWGGSPVYFTQIGYAVLENAAIPIIGEGDKQPNDTYVQQLVDGAKAAVDAGVATGTVDRNRVGVMGHSYGAFMTANLLAHTDIFRAGIARSGAYNRTLTPYGFQNEERTYWQDPKVYFDMSPFSYADKIKTPILLIHGEADDNTGTFPIQSERFYAALKGQGATVRLVFLPLEPHHYGAHESLQHMLWEMSRWLDTYVKPETSPATKSAE
ncbi:prolyl oligopeptidase family serine peptidase [Granulicella sp. 5B5]|uniref:alpha/beta hydrolase family protein n=1 Tax=Granulicella sp. 5B5 TaxID=1617967 RepID=UPI0015F56C01|nr:prolyl oligopeptidase family serine peptidase [Granulicella sp. 5B5]QMV18213.1 prolyl oligopeptidase family serine peptidase [Granulicella sp. 5B5]